MKLMQIIEMLEKYCPNYLASSNDSIGLQIANDFDQVKKILIALDCSEKAINHAILQKCDFILTHHPLFWPNKIEGEEDWATQKKIQTLNKHKIKVYTLHTNYDEKYLKTLMLNVLPLKELKQHSDHLIACGKLKKSLTKKEFLKLIIKNFKLSYCLHNNTSENEKINKIAIVPGSGGFALDFCKKNKIKTIITGELKWNDWIKSEDYKINAIAIGHDQEQLFIADIENSLKKILINAGSSIKIIKYFHKGIQSFHD